MTGKNRRPRPRPRPKWSELQLDLLELILEKLDLVAHARFASVCSSWRSAAIHNLPINKPLSLVLSHDPLNLVRRFITSFVPTWRKARFMGALDGWLVILIDRKDLFLFNKGMGSNSIIPLPSPPKDFLRNPIDSKAVLSSPPSALSGECTVVLKHEFAGLFYCRLGSDTSFTKLSGGLSHIEDMLFYKEQLYVLCKPDIIMVFDLPINEASRSSFVIHMPNDPTPRRLLISGKNNILITVAGWHDYYSVFKLEGDEPRPLVRANDIGGDFQILISNPYCSLSITTKEHKEFRRTTDYFEDDRTFALDMSKDPNKAKADDPWPLFFVMFSCRGIKNEIIIKD